MSSVEALFSTIEELVDKNLFDDALATIEGGKITHSGEPGIFDLLYLRQLNIHKRKSDYAVIIELKSKYDQLTDVDTMFSALLLYQIAHNYLAQFQDSLNLALKAEAMLSSLEEDADSPLVISPKHVCELYMIWGRTYFRQGDLKASIEKYGKALVVASRYQLYEEIFEIKNSLAGIHFEKGELTETLQIMTELVNYSIKVKMIKERKFLLANLAMIHHKMGNLREAENILKQYIDIAEGDLTPSAEASYLTNYGFLLLDKGRVEEALNNFKKALVIREVNDIVTYIPFTKGAIGQALFEKKELTEALKQVIEGIEFSKKIRSVQYLPELYFTGIKIALHSDNQDLSGQFLADLKVLDVNEDSTRIEILSKFSEALIYKNQTDIRSLAKSKDLFLDLLKYENVDYTTSIDIKVHYCDILLAEFSIFEDLNIITEVSQVFYEIYETGRKFNQFLVIINSLVLQSKMAIVTNNPVKALNLLKEAKDISKEKDLNRIHDIILNEELKLKQIVEKWTKIGDKEHIELLEATELREYLGSVAAFMRRVGS